MTKTFLQWWLFFVLQLIILGASYIYKVHIYILNNDQTYISFILIGIWLLTSMRIGYKLLKNITTSNERYWFVAETCLVLGLIGTVSGFIIMLGSTFTNLDVGDITSMTNALTTMSIGMSAALYTTLMGLLSSLSIKVQLINLERTIQKI